MGRKLFKIESTDLYFDVLFIIMKHYPTRDLHVCIEYSTGHGIKRGTVLGEFAYIINRGINKWSIHEKCACYVVLKHNR